MIDSVKIEQIKLVLVCLVAIVIWWFAFSVLVSAVKQRRNIPMAIEQARILKEKFSADTNFSNVSFSWSSGGEGFLTVHGYEVSIEQVGYITNLIQAQKCGVAVYYALYFGTNRSGTNCFRQIVK